ncbi:MAG: amidohydrolase family protein [Planctomyces sp.]|nr:amidohydrolase family protein [Planctomyces sp.]
MIDTNVYLERWPFRRLTADDSEQLVATLKALGITQAWAGSFDGLFHRDIGGVNERLSQKCRESDDGFLIPFGTVNPTLPDWEDDLRRIDEEFQMPGIRLHPAYHGYMLDDSRFAELLRFANDRSLAVQLVVGMEDERTQHTLHRIPSVDLSPLKAVLKEVGGTQIMILNAFRSVSVAQAVELTLDTSIHFDIAMLEGIAGAGKLIESLPAERIVFGTHAPLFYPDSAILKLIESGLPEAILLKLKAENAANWLANR